LKEKFELKIYSKKGLGIVSPEGKFVHSGTQF
jgi:hypothetical protein